MVERKGTVIDTSDPQLTIKEMQFAISTTTGKITGVLIACQQRSFVYPEKGTFNQPPLATKICLIEFKSNSYLKSIQLYENDGAIQQLDFTFFNTANNSLEQVVTIGESVKGCSTRNYSAEPAHFLNVFKLIFSPHLKDLVATQTLLPTFQPLSLVKTVADKNENYILNYSDLKKLLSLIPPDDSVPDQTFKELFSGLRQAINKIQEVKLSVSDAFQDNSAFIETLENNFKEIARAISPSLAKGEGKFKPSEFPRESKKLQDLLSQLNDCLKNLNSLKPKVASLRDLSSVISKLKAKLFSDEQVKHSLRMYTSTENLQAMAQGSLANERRTLQNLMAERNGIEQRLSENKRLIQLEDQIIKDKKEMREEVSKQSQALSKQIMGSKLEDFSKTVQVSGVQKVDSLEEEYQKNITDLNQEYQRKKAKLEERIEKERDKMSSDVTQQTQVGKKESLYYFIIILDESGSMIYPWQSVQDTFQKFIEPFKEDNQCKHLFSTILFDHGARYLDKRVPAKSLQPLPQLHGGGTTYSPALVLAQQLVTLTPAGMRPVILFMTDGATDQFDIEQSKKILQDIFKSQKEGVFFAIGFGPGYARKTLEDLSLAANGGKTSVTIDQSQYNLVLEAIDDKELLEIFVGISSSFEKSAQEAAIDALERQRKLDEEAFEKQLDFYNKQYQKQIEDLNKRSQYRAQMKQAAEDGMTEDLKRVIKEQETQLDLELQDYKKKQEDYIKEKSEMEARLVILNESIKDKEKDVKEAEKRLNENTDKQKEIEQKKAHCINEVIKNSGLQDLEGVRQIFSYLESVAGTIESLVASLKQSKNLLEILRTKIDDMEFQFEGHLEKEIKKNMSENEIGERIIKIQKLDESFKGKGVKDILIEALKQSYSHYSTHQKFYDKLIDWMDFTAVAICTKKKLGKYARLYAKKLKPQEDKEDSDDSDSDSDSDSPTTSSSIQAGKKTMLQEIMQNPEEYDNIEPLYFSEVKTKILSIKKKLAEEKKKKKEKKEKYGYNKEKWREIKQSLKDKRELLLAEEKYYNILQDENKLQHTLEICLKNIHNILCKAIGNDIAKRIYQDFSNIFCFFQECVQNKLLPYNQTVHLLQLENERDINQALDQLRHDKSVLALQQAEELQSTPALTQQPQRSFAQIEY